MIETLVFDLGGVLMDHNRLLLAPYWNRLPKSLLMKYGSGQITTEAFLQEVHRLLPEVAEQELIPLWNSLHGGIPESRLEAVRHWHKQMPCFVLSNNNPLHWQDVLDTYPDFKTLFDGFILSHEVQIEKPDMAIYEETDRQIARWYEEHGRTYHKENTLFLDDSKENCQAAINNGWQARMVYHVVGAVIWDQGEVLCVQKPKTKYAYTSLHWEYPGGKVEAGETEAEALKRELLEEMDYPIDVLAPLSKVDYMYPDFAVQLHFYLCRPSNTEQPRAFRLKEHVAAHWVRPEQIPFVGELTQTAGWCEADHYLQADPAVVDVLSGTAFQKDVWRALCAIPRGETRTYSEVAAMAGHPTAVRAVAHAIHCNPLPYFIPCHRVVPASGGIGQYAYGAALKRKLLLAEDAIR